MARSQKIKHLVMQTQNFITVRVTQEAARKHHVPLKTRVKDITTVKLLGEIVHE